MTWPSGLGLGIPWQTIDAGLNLNGVLTSLRPRWWYNWLSRDAGMPDYYPMLWKPVPGDSQWNELAQHVKDTGQEHFLYNEPEWSNQSNTSPQEALSVISQWRLAARKAVNGAWVYPKWMGPGVLIHWDGAPAWEWMDEFINTSGAARLPQRWAIHIYAHDAAGWLTLWNMWRSWMQKHKSKHAVRRTIVTEMACWDDSPYVQRDVMLQAIETMQSDNLLEAVCWFSAAYGWTDAAWKRSDLLNPSVTENGEESILSTHAPRKWLGNEFRAWAGSNDVFLPIA